MSALENLRYEIDDFMKRHPQSPIPRDERSDFTGLNYYAFDPAFVITGMLEHFGDDEPLIQMDTSTGDSQHYRRWARLTFTVDGQEAALTIYADPYGHDLFLPFKDATNGKETYGAGRYMDSHRPGLRLLGRDHDRMEVDFNFCYAPYCAYNAAYSCPLPPRENWLKVAIRAGEKNYK